MVIEEALPLVDHTESTVVDDDYLKGYAVDGGRGHLLRVHLEGTVACDADHLVLRTADLSADGRGEAKAHGAQTARRDEGAGVLAMDILVRPHLVLSYFGGDDRSLRI